MKKTRLSASTTATIRSTKIKRLSLALGIAIASQMGLAQADVAPVSTQGNKVLFGGQQGSVAGMSMFWSNTGWGAEKYYNGQTVGWLKSDWNAKLVRAAMGVEDNGGYLTDSTNKTRVTNVVDAAIANDMYVIIDWHTHKAELNKAAAISFFTEMATKYGSKNHVIYEIYNEPLQVSWSNVIKPYAVDVIKAIRAIDPDNLIIVGTPTWSQDVDAASNDPITGYSNIAYTLHFYAGTHGASLRSKAQTALNNGIPLFVTEWGSVNADGDGGVANSETNAWMDFLRTNKISHANWSLTDKSEGAAALTSGASANGGWTNNQLTTSGALAKSLISGWPALTSGGNSSTANSSVRSSVAPSSQAPSSIPRSSSSAPATSGQQCNWYGTPTPLCANTASGWGWENSKSCVGPTTCSAQPAPYGITGGASSTPASSVAPSSTPRSSLAPSSVPRSSVAPSSAPRSSVAASSTPATSTGASCTQVIGNEWNNGFTGSIRIVNNGTSAINGWNIGWSYSDGTRVTSSWNATVSGSNPYTASNISWNGSIQPGQAVEFGIQASKGGSSVSNPSFSGLCK
jgi:endoglucanase